LRLAPGARVVRLVCCPSDDSRSLCACLKAWRWRSRWQFWRRSSRPRYRGLAICPKRSRRGAARPLLVGVGAIGVGQAGDALSALAPTVGFLAALLLIAEGARREGLFDALGAVMARGSRANPRRLLAFVVAIAAAVTALLSLDATIVLLTPIVFATAIRMRVRPRPQVYACAHLANSASLLLPISNLTNLLAFHATRLSFARFAALMALPTLGVVLVEWIVLRRFFAEDLRRPRRPVAQPARPPLPRFALMVLAFTLAGFALSSVLRLAPVWVAIAGAAAINVPALVARRANPLTLARTIEPGFLVFVLGLGVVVAGASSNGLASAVRDALPVGASLPDLLAIAALSAVLANLVNNLPATLILILIPVAVGGGPGAVLAMLVGVNVGPNLTYTGSLATLLWRRVLRAKDTDVQLRVFVSLGALTVPAALVTATLLLWCGLQV
jgi:arsenical pump membrane protein